MSTELLAAYAAKLKYEDLPSHTVEMAKKCILDWAGVCIRGSQEEPIRILQEVVAADPGKGAATVCTDRPLVAGPAEAALLNGAASHSLDFDDLHNASVIHLATVVVPAALAICQAEKKSGKDLITAVVAGYEIGARVGETIIPESYHYWHTTGTAGIFGAAAAAGNALGLSAAEMQHCLGTAGTQAAGLWEFLVSGAMSKTIHAGKAAYAGVLSAYLSAKGFTGAARILEGEKGFCSAVSPTPHWEKLTEDFGTETFKIDDNSFKPYPCCKHSHASIFAMLTLRDQFRREDLREIVIRVNTMTDSLINNPQPRTAYGGKFSIQYCVARAAVSGKVTIDHFTDEALRDPEVREWMTHIRVVRDEKMEELKALDPTKLASCLEIHLQNGQVLTQLVEYPKGDPANAMSLPEMKEKYFSLVTPVLGEERAETLATLILELEQRDQFAAEWQAVFGK